MRQTLDFGSWKALIVCFPFVFLLLATLPGAHSKGVAAKYEKSTSGIIDQMELNTHGQYRYHFAVDGKQYTHVDNVASREDAVPGHTVTVYYDSRDPDTSGLTEFQASSDTNSAIAILPGLGICGVIGIILLVKLHRWRKRSQAPPFTPGPR